MWASAPASPAGNAICVTSRVFDVSLMGENADSMVFIGCAQPEREGERWRASPGCGGERGGDYAALAGAPSQHRGPPPPSQKKECATLLYLSLLAHRYSQMSRHGLRTMVFGHVLQCQSKKTRELLIVEVTFSEGRIVKKNTGGKAVNTEVWKQGREGSA